MKSTLQHSRFYLKKNLEYLTGFQNLSGLIQHGGIDFMHVPNRVFPHSIFFGYLS